MVNCFSENLLTWFDEHGRHDLPWQYEINPYRVWVSEIMLQQTQVKTVIPYYQRFMQRFPNVQSLASADLDEVLHLWTGLGYYARGRNLYKAAGMIMSDYNGTLPDNIDDLISLPGIGRSTAGAILSIALDQRHPILDGNVKRVLTRMQAVEGWPGERKVAISLWQLAEELTPDKRVADYTQAIMDFGATVCTRSQPACGQCVMKMNCQAFQQDRVNEFPGRKPQKDKPVRTIRFLICENLFGEYLLVLRPPTGIWGGLWSFPELDLDADIDAFISKEYDFRRCSIQDLPSFRHTFSHFHLDIHPVCLKIEANGSRLAEHANIRWFTDTKNEALGLAAPVKKLLETLEKSILETLNDTYGTLRKTG